MDITFACESCGQGIVIDEAGAGLATECPKCGQPLTVPRQPLLEPDRDAQHPKFKFDARPKKMMEQKPIIPKPYCPICDSTRVSGEIRRDKVGWAAGGLLLGGPLGVFLGALLAKNKVVCKCHDYGYEQGYGDQLNAPRAKWWANNANM